MFIFNSSSHVAPAEFDHPTVLSKTPYSLYVSWDPPTSPNGRILNYTVLLNELVVAILINNGTQLVYNITQLSPHTEYSFSIIACNSAGCITSPFFSDITGEAGKINTVQFTRYLFLFSSISSTECPSSYAGSHHNRFCYNYVE